MIKSPDEVTVCLYTQNGNKQEKLKSIVLPERYNLLAIPENVLG